MKRGRLISVEGIDGSGKSTQIRTVLSTLHAHGVSVVQTREPGGTPLGERLRELLLNDSMGIESEMLLMFASRFQHVQQVIEPALQAGQWVVTDRFTDSGFAFQVHARGGNALLFSALESSVGLEPDLTLLFDLPVETAEVRRAARDDYDRFEREKADFHERAAQGYRFRVQAAPHRFRIINADEGIGSVTAQVRAAIQAFVCESEACPI